MENELGKIALLIDADNFIQINKIKPAILEISKYGKISLKRAYANWTKDQFSNWGDVLRNFAIKPIHQIDYVSGKNATDMALTIDAMDFLYNSDYDVFVIVSGDSDFTLLAIKLKESGKTVIGISAKGNTSEAFVSSCDNFKEPSISRQSFTKVPTASISILYSSLALLTASASPRPSFFHIA